MKVRAGLVILVGSATLAMSHAAMATAPRIVTGWPVVAASGSVHPGPDGGPAVISEGISSNDFASSVGAFRLNGRLRWVSAFTWGCGNCDDGHQIPGLQADGTFGPLGPEGDGSWSVDQHGRRVSGCPGAVLADGTRICHEARFVASLPARTYPAVVASRGGTRLWEYTQPANPWSIASEFNVPPIVYADTTTAYTSLGTPRTTPPLQLVALNLSDGTLRWQAPRQTPVAVLRTGVVARTGATGAGLTAFAADGTIRWSASVRLPPYTSRVLVDAIDGGVLVDEARGRVYAALATGELAALDAATGAVMWRTKAADHARPLSVGSNGLVYAGIDRDGRHALRAIGPDGRGRWQFDTTTTVTGALLLRDGTVAVSTAAADPPNRAGLLSRIDPRKAAIQVRSTRLTLSRTTFRSGCFGPSCEYSPTLGTVLRIAVPARTTLRVLLRRRNGSTPNAPIVIPAPPGVSHVRLFGDGAAMKGRGILEVSGSVRNRPLVVRFPVVIH